MKKNIHSALIKSMWCNYLNFNQRHFPKVITRITKVQSAILSCFFNSPDRWLLLPHWLFQLVDHLDFGANKVLLILLQSNQKTGVEEVQ